VDGDEFEFIEIKNIGSAPVHLYNLRLSAGVDFTFPPGSTIPAGGFVVLAKNAVRFALKYPGVAVDAFGDTIMSFAYDDDPPWPTSADGGGRSLVPIQPNSNAAPNLSSSWRVSTNLGGSPGADDP
jgi:hypothetical protein